MWLEPQDPGLYQERSSCAKSEENLYLELLHSIVGRLDALLLFKPSQSFLFIQAAVCLHVISLMFAVASGGKNSLILGPTQISLRYFYTDGFSLLYCLIHFFCPPVIS